MLASLLIYLSFWLNAFGKARNCELAEFRVVKGNGTCDLLVKLCNSKPEELYVDVEVDPLAVKYLTVSKGPLITLKPFSENSLEVHFEPLSNTSVTGIEVKLQFISTRSSIVKEEVVRVRDDCVLATG